MQMTKLNSPNESMEVQSEANLHARRDLLSELPDEIVASILSQLPMRDAIRSSVLSRRWRSLCIRLWKRLIFHPNHPIFGGTSHSFVEWVDRTLKRYKHHQIIHEFAVRFGLDPRFSDAIDAWLRFLLTKDVERLELTLSGYIPPTEKWESDKIRNLKEKLWGPVFDGYIYRFPKLKRNLLCANNKGFGNIRELSLAWLYIDEETVEYFIYNCVFLEGLNLRNVSGIKHLRIEGENLKLKRLELFRCNGCWGTISVPKLESLVLDISDSVRLESIPLLSELSIGGRYCISNLKKFAASSFPQLKKLKLHLDYEEYFMCHPIELPKFMKLEELTVTMNGYEELSPLWLFVPITEAPFLRKFVFCFSWTYRKVPISYAKECFESVRRTQETTLNPHGGLKVVEIHGFMAWESHVILAKHLFRMAQSLEEVFIYSECSKARQYAEELVKGLPYRVNIVTYLMKRQCYFFFIVEWVDRTLKLYHHRQTIREFAVRRDLSCVHSDFIDAWKEGFLNLRELSWASLDIDEKTIEYFLSICLFLEGLCLRNVFGFKQLKFEGENLMLKRLELDIDCWET